MTKGLLLRALLYIIVNGVILKLFFMASLGIAKAIIKELFDMTCISRMQLASYVVVGTASHKSTKRLHKRY